VFKAKKSIPAVAGASLLLGGGCDDGPSVSSIAADLCRGIERCDPDYFSDAFNSSQAECQDYYADAYETESRAWEEYGEDCHDALLEYVACYAEAYGSTCGTGEAECEALYAEADELCPDGAI
jgi:hypothetical protein